MVRTWKEELWRYPCGEPVIGVALSPNADRIVATSVNKYVYFLNQTGKVLWKRELDHPGWGVTISNDGNLVGVCTASKKLWEGSIYLFTAEGQNILKQTVKGPLWSISTSGVGVLVVGCWDNYLYILKKDKDNWKNWRKLKLREATKGIFGTSITEDGNTIVAGSFDGFIYILEGLSGRIEKIPSEAGVFGISTSSDGNLITAGLENGHVLYYDRLRKHMSKCKIAQAEVCGVSLTPTGNLTAIGSFDQRIYLANQEEILWQHKIDDRAWGVAINKTGEFVVAGADDGNIYFIRNFCLEGSLTVLSNELDEILHKNNKCNTAESYHTLRARFYLENNLLDKALKEAERAYELLPSDEAITILLIELYKRKLNLIPEDFETHFKLGLMYKRNKRFDEAVKELSFASSDPRLTDKAMELIRECISLGAAKDATLLYDDIAYIKYDYPSLEDEIKKNTEIFHALTRIRSIPNIGKILDIGCATGRYPFTFVNQGYDVIGIDVSPQAISRCNLIKALEETRWGKLKIRFLCMDARKTSFEDSSFDLATCMMGTFAHFTSDDQETLLREVWRILKHGGHLMISTWNPKYANAKYLGFYRKKDREAIRQNLMTPTELKELLTKMGFSDIEVFNFALLPDEFYYELDLDNLRKEDFQKIIMIESYVSKSFPALEGQMYLIHAQKKETEKNTVEWGDEIYGS